MSNIKNTSVLDLLPPNLKSDPDIIAASKAVDNKYSTIASLTDRLIILSNLENQPDEILDHLLWQSHILDEEGASLAETRAEKIDLILNSEELHKIKGTPYALERVLEILNMRGIIQEWFEYGGEPGHFKIAVLEVSSRGLSEENFNMLEKLIYAYKKRSAHLDVINIFLTGRTKQYMATTLQTGEEVTVYPWRQGSIETKGTLSLGSASRTVDISIVYPQ